MVQLGSVNAQIPPMEPLVYPQLLMLLQFTANVPIQTLILILKLPLSYLKHPALVSVQHRIFYLKQRRLIQLFTIVERSVYAQHPAPIHFVPQHQLLLCQTLVRDFVSALLLNLWATQTFKQILSYHLIVLIVNAQLFQTPTLSIQQPKLPLFGTATTNGVNVPISIRYPTIPGK